MRRKLLLGVILLFSINVEAQSKTAGVGNLKVLVVHATVSFAIMHYMANRAYRHENHTSDAIAELRTL